MEKSLSLAQCGGFSEQGVDRKHYAITVSRD